MGEVIRISQFKRQGFREGRGEVYYGWMLRRLVMGRKPRRTWRAIWVLCACLGVAYGIVAAL